MEARLRNATSARTRRNATPTSEFTPRPTMASIRIRNRVVQFFPERGRENAINPETRERLIGFLVQEDDISSEDEANDLIEEALDRHFPRDITPPRTDDGIWERFLSSDE